MTAPSPNEGGGCFLNVKMLAYLKKKCYIWSVTTGESHQRIGRKKNVKSFVKNLHIWMTFIIFADITIKQYKIMAKDIFEEKKELVWEVQTLYKSGRMRTDYINADDENELWEIYDKHHNKAKIADTAIGDCWPL